MSFMLHALQQALDLLLDSSVYIIFGLLVSGFLRVFLSPNTVAHHLGQGRYRSVFKAALLGIPIPLCSCGVLPAAASLKKQGANNGATTAFLISTPESGIDSMAITYALLDPIMTVARPLVAFATAAAAGIMENLFKTAKDKTPASPDLTCPVDACCDGQNCSPQAHRRHHGLGEKMWAGLKYAVTDLWADLAGWFFIGLLLAGTITALIPNDLFGRYLGGGLMSMLLMLALGIPLYICATASTPIAAALILKGVSPGAALVFLIAGPATNVASLTVLFGILGKRATAIYLSAIAISTVIFGLALDQFYQSTGFSAQAMVGKAAQMVPQWVQWLGALTLVLLSIRPIFRGIRKKLGIVSSELPEIQHGAGSEDDVKGVETSKESTCECSSRVACS